MKQDTYMNFDNTLRAPRSLVIYMFLKILFIFLSYCLRILLYIEYSPTLFDSASVLFKSCIGFLKRTFLVNVNHFLNRYPRLTRPIFNFLNITRMHIHKRVFAFFLMAVPQVYNMKSLLVSMLYYTIPCLFLFLNGYNLVSSSSTLNNDIIHFYGLLDGGEFSYIISDYNNVMLSSVAQHYNGLFFIYFLILLSLVHVSLGLVNFIYDYILKKLDSSELVSGTLDLMEKKSFLVISKIVLVFILILL